MFDIKKKELLQKEEKINTYVQYIHNLSKRIFLALYILQGGRNKAPVGTMKQHEDKIILKLQHHKTTGCSPSSSEITISESVNSRERGSDFGTGLITCKDGKL